MILGVVKFGPAQKGRLLRFNVVMLVVNVLAFVLGVVVALLAPASGQVTMLILSSILLIACSLTAYLLDFRRLYLYGLLVWLAPLVGEWLYTNYQVPHHGFPITFGLAAAIMILTGLVVFVRLLRDNPPPEQQASVEGV